MGKLYSQIPHCIAEDIHGRGRRSIPVRMTTCSTVSCLSLLTVAFAGCTNAPAAPDMPEIPVTPSLGSDRATVMGYVKDADGVALPDATVSVRATGESAVTDANGAFTLDVPANTTLTIAATAPNMATTLLPQFMIAPESSAVFEI